MAARAGSSGGGTKRIRSNRPGRRNAVSRCQGGIGYRKQQDAIVVALNTVAFREELVDELPAAMTAHVGPAGGQCVDLVEEEHARLSSPRLFEKLVQVALAVAEPHVEHFMDPDRHELGADLAGRGPGQVRLAAARRTVHHDAPTDRLAIGPVQLGMSQRVNNLESDLLLDSVYPSHVGECDPGPL